MKTEWWLSKMIENAETACRDINCEYLSVDYVDI